MERNMIPQADVSGQNNGAIEAEGFLGGSFSWIIILIVIFFIFGGFGHGFGLDE